MTAGLGINLNTVDRSMADVLVGRATLDEVIRPTETERIDVVPAHIDLAATEGELFTMLGRESVLRDALDGRLKNRYDYALIDCPPNLGLLTVNGLVAANGVIIPVQTQYYAMKGLTNLVKVINTIRLKLNRQAADPRAPADVLRRPDEPGPGHARRAARRRRPPRLQFDHPQHRQAR